MSKGRKEIPEIIPEDLPEIEVEPVESEAPEKDAEREADAPKSAHGPDGEPRDEAVPVVFDDEEPDADAPPAATEVASIPLVFEDEEGESPPGDGEGAKAPSPEETNREKPGGFEPLDEEPVVHLHEDEDGSLSGGEKPEEEGGDGDSPQWDPSEDFDALGVGGGDFEEGGLIIDDEPVVVWKDRDQGEETGPGEPAVDLSEAVRTREKDVPEREEARRTQDAAEVSEEAATPLDEKPEPPEGPTLDEAVRMPPVTPPKPSGPGPDTPEEPSAPKDDEPGDVSGPPPGTVPQGWIEAPLPDYPDFVLDIGGTRHLFRGEEAVKTDSIDEYPRHLLYVVDYPAAPGPHVATVDGPAKYAMVLLRKRLQEEGELTEENTLVILDRRKLGSQRTKVAYEMVPAGRHHGLMNMSVKTLNGYLLFNTTALAHGLVSGLFGGKPGAVALHLPGFIVLAAGRGKRLQFARRYALAGEDEFALRSGMANLHQDLATLNQQGEVEVSEILWLEGLTETLVWPEMRLDLPVNRLPVHRIKTDDGDRFSSLPGVISKVDISLCLGPREDARLLPFQPLEKWIWLGMGVVGAALVTGALLTGVASDRLGDRIDELERNNDFLRRELTFSAGRVQGLNKDLGDFQPILKVARDVVYAGKARPVSAIWRELHRLKPGSMYVHSLEIRYTGDAATATMTGSIDAGLVKAQDVFARFLSTLGGAGWRVDKQTMRLDVESNTFALEATLPGGAP